MKKTVSRLLLFVSALLLFAFTTKNNSIGKQDSFVIHAKPDDPKPGTSIFFTVTCFDKGVSFTWDFGDGSSKEDSYGPGISHSYSSAGTYLVKVHSSDGRIATDLAMVTK